MDEPTIVKSWRCTNLEELQRALADAAGIVAAHNQLPGMCGLTPLNVTLKRSMMPVSLTAEEWRELKQAGEFDRVFDVVVEAG